MGSKTQTSTSNNVSSYTPAALSQLQNIYSTVANAANTPYTPYTGELTAGLTSTQQNAINNANQYANVAQPYYQQAGQLASNAANPLTSQQIQNYMSPYTQSVVDATQAQFNNQNAQQQSSLLGNAALQGALGGDRSAVAQANLAGQQQLAQAPVIANLYNTGYNNAYNAAQQQYQQNPLAAASSLGNIGAGSQSAALAGLQGQLTAGGTEQTTNQNADTAAYQQYLNQQAYPFQTAQFLASLGVPTLGAMGGTTVGTGTQTAQNGNGLAQGLGLGLSALSLFSDERVKDGKERIGETYDGQPIYRFRYKGEPTVRIGLMAQDVEKSHPDAVGEQGGIKTVNYDDATKDAASKGHFADGGSVLGATPFNFISDAHGYVPKVSGVSGGQAQTPKPTASAASPSPASSQQNPWASVEQQLNGMSGKLGGLFGGNNSINPLGSTGLSLTNTGGLYADGGAVSPFSFDDRWNDLLGPPSSDNDVSDIKSGPGSASDPIRLTDPKDMQTWRDSTDSINPDAAAIIANPAGPVPPQSNPTSGAPSGNIPLPPQITGGQRDGGLPTDALPFAGTGSVQAPMAAAAQQANPNTMGGWNPLNLSDKTRQALIAAGLGAASSRSPFALQALGEGGLYGLKSYNDLTKAEQDALDKKLSRQMEQQRIDQEAERIANQAKQASQTLGLARERFEYEKNNPDQNVVPLGSSADGSKYYLLDKKSGQLVEKDINLAPTKPSPSQSALAKSDAKRVDDLTKAADAAREGLQSLDNIDALRGQAYTGPVTGYLADKLGHAPTVAMESATNNLALSLAQKMKGSLSDKDVAFLKSQVPNLNQTGEAGAAVSGMIRSGLERAAQKSQFYRDYLDVNGTLSGADQQWDKYSKENPLTTEDKKAVGGRKFNPDYNKDYTPYLSHRKVQQQSSAPTNITSPPQRPSSVPAGSSYSPSRKMWRSSDGTQFFDANGNRVR